MCVPASATADKTEFGGISFYLKKNMVLSEDPPNLQRRYIERKTHGYSFLGMKGR